MITMRGAIALVIDRWEKCKCGQFEEVDHPHYGHFEAREHLHGFGDGDTKDRPE